MEEKAILALEQAALARIHKYRQEQGLTETEFGKLAFPEAPNPRVKVNNLTHAKTANGKPLRLRLGDFCTMCVALGKDPTQELFSLWQEAKQNKG